MSRESYGFPFFLPTPERIPHAAAAEKESNTTIPSLYQPPPPQQQQQQQRDPGEEDPSTHPPTHSSLLLPRRSLPPPCSPSPLRHQTLAPAPPRSAIFSARFSHKVRSASSSPPKTLLLLSPIRDPPARGSPLTSPLPPSSPIHSPDPDPRLGFRPPRDLPLLSRFAAIF